MRLRPEWMLVMLLPVACAASVGPQDPPELAWALPDAAAPRVDPPKPPSATDYAWTHMQWPLAADQAESILANTEIFADAAVFNSGEPSPQVAAFNVLLDQEDALVRFERLADGSKVAGRLYALCGFQVLNRPRYQALAEELKQSSKEVETQFGCIGGREKVAELVQQIGKQKYGRYFRESKTRIYSRLSDAG